MDEKYKRSYRWRLTAMIMLFLLVLAVIFIAIFALPNDEGQPTTETNKTISGSVNFTGATDNTFYIKEVRLQEGEDEAEVLSITPGYINNGFAFTEIGEVSSDDITLYFDIINSTTNTAVISSSWTDTEVDGVTFSVIEESRYLSAGTGEEITDSTEINGTLILELNLYNAEAFNLSNITMSFDEPEVYTWWYFETNEEDMTATLTNAMVTNGILEVPAYVSYDEETQTWVSGPDYKVVAIDGVDRYHGAIAKGVTELILPETVVEIGDYTFCNGGFIGTTLDLSNTKVERIGDYAFEASYNLTTIYYPTTLESVEGAYSNCYAITETFTCSPDEKPQTKIQVIDDIQYYVDGDDFILITPVSRGIDNVVISGQTTEINRGAFAECGNIVSVDLPENLTSIEDFTFYFCTALTTIDLSRCTNLTSIGDYSFYGCSGLANVKLPNSIESIGYNAFCYCDALQTQTDEYGVQYIGNDESPYLFLFDASGLTANTYAIKENCKVIYDNAFDGLTTLTSITFPSSIKSINSSAFQSCSGLETLEYKGTLEQYLAINMGSAWIGNSYSLSLDIDGNGETEEVTSLVIPESITEIQNYAFYNCGGITEITLSDSLTNIGDYAFAGCTGLLAIDLSVCTNLASIGASVFYNCSNLANVKLPNSIESIAQNTFSRCSGLTSITLPESLTSIGVSAFSSCTGLLAIDLSVCTNLTGIGASAFSGCTGLTSINLPNNIEFVGRNAFSNCGALQTDDYGVQYIGNDENPYLVLVDASGLMEDSYIVNSNCRVIGANAFYGIRPLTKSLTLSSSIVFINDSAFNYCSDFTTIDLSVCTNLTSIGSYAFSGCDGLATIDLSVCTNLTSIGDWAFSGCDGLASATLNQYLFENATSDTACGNLLQNITSGETVYVPANLIDELHLTNSYLDGDTFTRSESAVDEYYIYTKI